MSRHLFGRNVVAQHCVDSTDSRVDRQWQGKFCPYIRWVCGERTTCNGDDKIDCVQQVSIERVRIDPALEPVARISRNSKLAPCRADTARIECGDLEQDVGCAVGY